MPALRRGVPAGGSKTAGEGGGAAPLSGFIMTEIDLLKRSSFAWVDLFGTTTR
jgi:hypothetical protein